MNVLALSLTPSISSNEPFLIKGLLKSLKSKWKQTVGGEGSSLSLCPLCEKFFKKIFQTANRVPSNKLLGSWWKFYEKGVDLKLFIYIYMNM